MNTPTLAILIPAAGASSRMRGKDKLAEPVDGIPVLRRAAWMALAVSPKVMVTLPANDHPRAQIISDLPVTCLTVPDAVEGMSASLRAGAAVLTDADHLMILPADMPDLTEADLHIMADAMSETPKAILRATSTDGTPGHPVIFPPNHLPTFATLSGDQGAREILRAHAGSIRFVSLPGTHALTDLDTPEDWATWRAANPTR